MKTAVEKATWFLETFGLELHSISVKPVPCPQSPPSHESAGASEDVISLRFSGQKQPESSVRQTLYLLERFGVSDKFYHELLMRFPSLPRLYSVKRTRQLLTEEVEYERLPPLHCETYRSFEETLKAVMTREVCQLINTII